MRDWCLFLFPRNGCYGKATEAKCTCWYSIVILSIVTPKQLCIPFEQKRSNRYSVY